MDYNGDFHRKMDMEVGDKQGLGNSVISMGEKNPFAGKQSIS